MTSDRSASISHTQTRIDPTWCPAIVVTLLIILMHLWQLGTPPLAGTEGHRALTAHQMVQSGDWLVPHLWGNVYLRKPPMQYWLIGSLEWLTGIANTWIWRLPSLLCGALLGGMLVKLTTHHAGRLAGWGCGLAYASLIAIWQQTRSADIDSANTFFSVMAAIGLLQLQDRTPVKSRQYALMLMVFVGVSATLLLKFHGALPVIVGAWLGPWLFDRAHSRKPWDWRLWSPIVLGCVPMLIWVSLVYQQFSGNTHMADDRGLTEIGMQVTGPLQDYFKAAALPLTLLLYSLPISLSVVMLGGWLRDRSDVPVVDSSLWLNLRRAAVVATVIYMIAASFNPRYAYPILPLLCPLAGIMLGDWLAGQHADHWQDGLTLAVGVFLWLLVIIHGVLAGILIKQVGLLIPVVVSLTIAVIAAFASEWNLRQAHRGRCLMLLAVVLMSLAVTFSALRNLKQKRGGYVAATELAAMVQKTPDEMLLARKVAYDQPEMFYYAGRKTTALPRDMDTLLSEYPKAILVLNISEYKAMAHELAPFIANQTPLNIFGRPDIRVVWIDAKQHVPGPTHSDHPVQ